jgi:hypothetical protein
MLWMMRWGEALLIIVLDVVELLQDEVEDDPQVFVSITSVLM